MLGISLLLLLIGFAEAYSLPSDLMTPSARQSEALQWGYSLANVSEMVTPCLDAAGITSLLEIGSFRGELTEKLLEWAEGSGCQVSTVEPLPPDDLLDLARRAHFDKFFIGFESVNPDNRRELGGKSKGLIAQYKEAIKVIQAHGIGVVGLFVFGFDHDTPQTLADTWDFVRDSELDSTSMTILTPYPGTPFRAQLVAEDRLMDKPWRYYDTAHVTYYPKQMTVEELERTYDWFCRKVYSPWSMGRRGWRTLRRHPVSRMPRKMFGSFSTDYGYRRTFNWRHVDGSRLLNAWGTAG